MSGFFLVVKLWKLCGKLHSWRRPVLLDDLLSLIWLELQGLLPGHASILLEAGHYLDKIVHLDMGDAVAVGGGEGFDFLVSLRYCSVIFIVSDESCRRIYISWPLRSNITTLVL